MEGGTLADYLRREKRSVDMYSLVAMAFLDGKGTVKVSDFWFSNKRGAFSSSGSGKTLKRAAWQPPEVIAGTFLTPATDVYAFGIVLWELIAPPDMTMTLTSCSSSIAHSESSTSAQSSPVCHVMPSPSMTGLAAGSAAVEMNNTQLGPPEIPPNASPEVSDLLERCWQAQPERRPSIFQSMGAFEVPQELLASAGSGKEQPALFSQMSDSSASNNPAKHGDLNDEMAASMVSIMPIKMDSVALQMPQEIQEGSFTMLSKQFLAEHGTPREVADIGTSPATPHATPRKGSPDNNV
eukprot:m51a1_g12599 hypothetical protein (295) ;mRNA; f:14-1151